MSLLVIPATAVESWRKKVMISNGTNEWRVNISRHNGDRTTWPSIESDFQLDLNPFFLLANLIRASPRRTRTKEVNTVCKQIVNRKTLTMFKVCGQPHWASIT